MKRQQPRLPVAARGSDLWVAAMREQSAPVYRNTFQLGFFDETTILGPVEGDQTTLYVYDFIDMWGVDAAGFADALAQVETSEVLVRVNSPGGDVFDGITIHNLLRSSAKDVTVRVDGIAASAASVIALGADKREIAVGAQFMIHDPWAVGIGNAADMKAFAELLDKQGANIAELYAARTGEDDADEWRERMLAEGDGTWYMAQESVDVGLATSVATDDGGSVAAKAALTVLPVATGGKISSDPRGSEGDGKRSAEDERATRVANARRAIRQTVTNGAKV